MTKSRVKKVFAWSLLIGGIIGAVMSAFNLIAPGEPPLVVQLSWAAFWTTGIVGIIAADEPGLSCEDLDRIAERLGR